METKWNTNRSNGWDIYKELTTNNEVLEKVAESDGNDADKLMNKVNKELQRIKYNAFGKVKPMSRKIR